MALLTFTENEETGKYEAEFIGGRGTLQFKASEKTTVEVAVKINEQGLDYEGIWSSTPMTPAHWVKRLELTEGISVKVISDIQPTAAAYIVD